MKILPWGDGSGGLYHLEKLLQPFWRLFHWGGGAAWTAPPENREMGSLRRERVGLYHPKEGLRPLDTVPLKGGSANDSISLGVTPGLSSVQERMGTNDPASEVGVQLDAPQYSRILGTASPGS